MRIDSEADLANVRRKVSRLEHDDERLRDRLVSLLRNSSTAARIVCASEALAWDCYRLVAGLRFMREDGAVAEVRAAVRSRLTINTRG